MACTLPCLKQFLAMFESGMIGEYSGSGTNSNSNTATSVYYHTGSGSGKGTLRSGHHSKAEDSIALVSLARRCGCASGAAAATAAGGTATTNARPETSSSATRHRPASNTNSSDEIELSLRPDQAVGDYSVGSVSTAAAADASSFVSDRSGAAMIIKKTQRWEVTSTRDGW